MMVFNFSRLVSHCNTKPGYNYEHLAYLRVEESTVDMELTIILSRGFEFQSFQDFNADNF